MLMLAHILPAGGAATRDLLIGSAVAAAATLLLMLLGWAHRAGRTQVLGRMASGASRISLGLPGWAALPLIVFEIAALSALFGYYADVGTHIDAGRDVGPFANPAHYPILVGLAGLALAGALGVILGTTDERVDAVRFTSTWRVPVGTVFLLVCGLVGVSAFPMDDLWHRLFGQDVTLWGPTHVLMVGSASLAPIAAWMLFVQARRQSSDHRLFHLREVLFGGIVLTSLSALQGEYDFGVPQFRLVCQPLLIAIAAGLALTLARARCGRGAALAAVGVWLAIRGLVVLVTGPLLGHPTPHFPLYLGAAVAVEAAALLVGTRALRRFAWFAGVGVGVVGTLGEWGWSQVWMPLPWPSQLLPSALVVATIGGVAAAQVGVYIASRFGVEGDPPRALSVPAAASRTDPAVGRRASGRAAVGGIIVALGCLATVIPLTSVNGFARVTVTDRSAEGLQLRIELDPATLAQDSFWFNVTSWQGGGLVLDPLQEQSPGVFVTTKRIPADGTWKSMLRIQRGSAISAVPLWLPEDPGIPVEGIDAPDQFLRPFLPDAQVVRREERPGAQSARRVGLAALGGLAILWLAVGGFALRRLRRPAAALGASPTAQTSDIAIIGAGFSGIGAAVRLHEAGFTDVAIFERAADVGGTWRDNHYPGCACDIPSHLYSLSFAPNPSWNSAYAAQPQILDYLRHTADEHHIRSAIRFNHELIEAHWDNSVQRWQIRFANGSQHTARVLVSAVGGLSRPLIPNIEGLSEFNGSVFHSAEWRHDVDLTGARVAVVGTGASAVQFIPQVAKQAAQVTVFQRTPPWVMGKLNRRISSREQALFRRFPALQRGLRGVIFLLQELLGVVLVWRPQRIERLERMARKHMERVIADPDLRAKLTPNYRMGCKRMLISNDYYPALAQDHVNVVSSGVASVKGSVVNSADGTSIEADVIILGTGFRPTDGLAPTRIIGADGVDLSERWQSGMSAYLGTTVVGYPNMFIVMGPNTGLGHNSQVYMIESQIEHIVATLVAMRDRGHVAVEVRPQVQDSYNQKLQERLAGSVWLTGGCSSWYLDRNGRNTTLWPGLAWGFRRRVRRATIADYRALAPGRQIPAGPPVDRAGAAAQPASHNTGAPA